MFANDRHLICAYVLLVGVPLLGLAGIMAAGRKMRAPAFVAGTWKIECAQDAGAQCFGLPHVVTVAQSGPRVSIMGGTPHPIAVGAVDGSILRVHLARAAQPCSDEILFRISGPPHRRTIAGQGFAPRNSGCAAVDVRGVQTPAKSAR